MADINISTDGTLNGTKLVVDGKEITKDQKVVGIDMSAYAPYKSKYSDEIISGGAYVSFEIVDENGKIERRSFGETKINYPNGIGPKIESSDNIVRFIGKEVNNDISDIVDKIVDHCEKNDIKCRDKDVLLSRTKESLIDMASDLSIELEDSSDESSEESEDEDSDSENLSDSKHDKGGFVTGSTSSNNSHKHTYSVDKKGNGRTSKDQSEKMPPHVHNIKNWKVLENPEEGYKHTHTIKQKKMDD